MTNSKLTIKALALTHITLDPRCQMRVKLNDDHVKSLAEVLAEGEKAELKGDLPVVYCDGHTNWLSDGFHRHSAHEQAGRKKMKCEVRQGGFDDAFVHALGANASHGLKRSNEDKQRYVEMAISYERFAKMSDRQIADICGVSHTFVSSIRKQHPGGNGCHLDETRIGKDGKSYPASSPAKASTSGDSAPAVIHLEPASETPKIDAEKPIPYTVPASEKHPAPSPPSAETEPADTEDSEDLREPEDGGDGYTGPMEPVKVLRDAKGRICFNEKTKVAFAAIPAFEALLTSIDDAIDDAKAIRALPGGAGIHLETSIAHAKNFQTAIRDARPYIVCPIHDTTLPHAHDEKNCGVCGGKGWVTARAYQNLNEDQKDVAKGWKEFERKQAEKAKAAANASAVTAV